jgi:hypothetical protein
MPVHPDTPEPLKTALERMEASVQSFKTSLPYTPPEGLDLRYVVLQEGLASAICELYEAASPSSGEPTGQEGSET